MVLETQSLLAQGFYRGCHPWSPFCSQTFLNIHMKTPVLETLFKKVAGLQRH